MNLPQTVTAEALAGLAAPDETLAVRVLIRRTANTGLQTLRGRFRRYIAKRDDKLGCHVIEIPLSVWMHGVPGGNYKDNLSVAHDIMGNRPATKAPLVVLIVPWKGAKKPVAIEEAEVKDLKSLRQLAEVLGAPDLLLSAIDLVASDRTPAEVEDALRVTIANVLEAPEVPAAPTGESPKVSDTSAEASPAAKTAAPATQAVAKKPAKKTARKKGKALSNAERQRLHRERKKKEREAEETAATTA